MAKFRAPTQARQVKHEHIYKDTRSFTQQLFEEAPKWDISIILIVCMVAIPFFYPAITWISMPLMLVWAVWAAYHRTNLTLPVKLPATLGKKFKDYNTPKIGNDNAFEEAGGTVFFGNTRDTKQEVWFRGKDFLTHLLVIGATGSGKTETLISISSSTAFCMGGGTIYVDAKAAPDLIFKFATLARLFGREDDLRIVNYITGGKAVVERDWARLSNTTNPFAQGTPNTAEQTLMGLLPAGGGDNQYFLDRAIAILRSILPALVELRDRGILNIYPSLIGQFISLKKFMELSNDIVIIPPARPDDPSLTEEDKNRGGRLMEGVKLSVRNKSIIDTFLKQLPGYDPSISSASEQPEQVATQFGFAEGYFARTLASLAGTYGHIYETDLGEADFVDIVMHNRILLVLVPAMEQANEERAALGKIVLSSIRSAMAQGLGSRGEGDHEDVIEALPIDLRIPTVIIVDEYAEVAVEGFAVTATQGRGLGMSVVFAGQDMAGFIRASEQEADMIFGNTKIKLLMTLEDAETTWRKFRELAGFMDVAQGEGWSQNIDGMSSYRTNMSARINRIERLDILDLKEQREGQGHLFEGSNIHRVQVFHHGIPKKKEVTNFRINRMLRVKPPFPDQVAILQEQIDLNIRLKRMLDGEEAVERPTTPLRERLRALMNKGKDVSNSLSWPLVLITNSDEDSSVLFADKDEPEKKQDYVESVGDTNTESKDETTSNSIVDSGLSDDLADMAGMDFSSNDDSAQDNVANDAINDFSGLLPPVDDIDLDEIEAAALENEGQSNSDVESLAPALSEITYSSSLFNTDIDGVKKGYKIISHISSLNESVGVKVNTEGTVEFISEVSDAIKYPTQDYEIKPDSEDVKELWDLLKGNDD